MKRQAEQKHPDMAAFMDSRKGRAQQFVDTCLAQLCDGEKLASAQLPQIISAMGAVAELFAPGGKGAAQREGSLDVTFRVVDKCE